MEELGSLLGSIFTGVAGGGVTGVIGVGMQMLAAKSQRAHDLAVLKAQNEQAKTLRQMDIDNAEKLAAAAQASAEKLAIVEAEQRAAEVLGANFRASHESDQARYLASEAQQSSRLARVLMAVVDFSRGMMRPAATAYSLVLLTILTFWMMDMYAQQKLPMTPAEASSLGREVLTAAIYIPTTCIVWWFGRQAAAK